MLRLALALLLSAAAIFTSNRVLADATPPQAAAPAKTAKPKIAKGETAIYVGDMHCAGCAKKIARKLYRLKGVVKVRTDVKHNLAIVTPQAKKQIDSKAAWKAVQAAGFQPTKLIGPQGTFVAHEKTKDAAQVAEAARPASR